MSERRQQAWDEAQRRYATGDRQAGFASGAAWAYDNPQPRTITREAAMEVWLSGEDFGDFADALRAAGIEVRDE